MTHLDQRFHPGLEGRVLGHDQHPDGFDGAVPRLGTAAGPPAQRRAGRFDSVEWIGLAAAAPFLSVRSVDFDDLDTHSAQIAGQPSSIAARALDADLGDVTEGLEPVQQRIVSGRVGSLDGPDPSRHPVGPLRDPGRVRTIDD
jgi:hypothetical protein